MAKSHNDREPFIRTAATGIGMMVLAIVSFLVMLWIVMAIVRVVVG